MPAETFSLPCPIPVRAIHAPDEAALERELTELTDLVARRLGTTIFATKRLNGQGLVFQLESTTGASWHLQIHRVPGYPSHAALRQCHALLNAHGVKHASLVTADKGPHPSPHGFLLHTWLPGTDARDLPLERWASAACLAVAPLQHIRPGFFGAFDGPRFDSLQDYFRNLPLIAETSFGDLLPEPLSFVELERMGYLTPGFLATFQAEVERLVQELPERTEPVLLHGDLFGANLLHDASGTPVLIDWDEARAGWALYEIARVTYWKGEGRLLYEFLQHEPFRRLSLRHVDVGIRLEHARQLLRQLYSNAFGPRNVDERSTKAQEWERKIFERLRRPTQME